MHAIFWQIVATVVLNIYDDVDAATGDDGDNVRTVSTWMCSKLLQA
jgi:hypothetical protein